MNILIVLIFLLFAHTVYAQECTQPSCFQQKDKELDGLAATTSAADRVPWFIDANGKMDLAPFTAYGRSLVGAASADAARTLLGVSVGGSAHVIEEEGAALTQRANMNFVGAGVTAADAGGKTVVTIPGGAGHVIKEDGTSLAAQPNLNFVGGGITCINDAGNSETECTVLGGHVIKNEGVAVAQQPNLNFVGTGVSCINDAGNNETECTIAAGAEVDPVVGAITGIVKADGAGNISAASAGTDYQAGDTELTCLAGTASAANKVPYYTGAGTCSTADYTALARSFTALTTLTNHGVVLGQGSSAPVATTAGTAGQYLRSGGAAADPAFAGITGAEVANTPAGTIAATTVQTALNELDGEKEAADADLTNIAGLSCAGILVRQGAADFECFTLTDHAGVIDITNPAGIAGAPAFRLHNKVVDGSSHFAADGGSTDAYAACPESISKMSTPAYVDGSEHLIRFNTANTVGATIDLCTLGTRPMVKVTAAGASVALATGDILVGPNYKLTYHASNANFQVMNPTTVSAGAAAGSTTEIQVNVAGAFGSYAEFTIDPSTKVVTATAGITSGDCGTGCMSHDATGVVGSKTATWPNHTGVVPLSPNAVKSFEIELFAPGVAATTGDGIAFFRVPSNLNGMILTTVTANVYTAGTTGTISFGLDRCAAAATGNVCSGTVDNMLTTNFTIDSGENSTSTAAAAGAVNVTNATVATGQILRFNVDAIHTTPSEGALMVLEFLLPTS